MNENETNFNENVDEIVPQTRSTPRRIQEKRTDLQKEKEKEKRKTLRLKKKMDQKKKKQKMAKASRKKNRKK